MDHKAEENSSHEMVTEDVELSRSPSSVQSHTESLSINHINGMTRQTQHRKRPSKSEGSAPHTQNILFSMLSRKDDPPWGTEAIAESRTSLCGEGPVIEPAPQPDEYEENDLVDLSRKVIFTNGLSSEFLAPNDYRQRSQSMGSNFGHFVYNGVGGSTVASDASRTSSHDSLASFDSQSDSSQSMNGVRLPHSQSDVQLEVTRNRLKHLLMGGRVDQELQGTTSSSGGILEESYGGEGSLSQPGTPPLSTPNYSLASRKYSEGSRSHLKSKAGFRGVGATGLDRAWPRGESTELQRYLTQPQSAIMSSRRRKPYSRPETHRPMDTVADDLQSEQALQSEEVNDDSNSLLKLMLTRGRSNSVSGFDSHRPNIIPRCSTMSGPRRQHVTLAKKNLLPIAARVSDRLNKVVEFATSLPEFLRMSKSDQMTLLVSACPRLLLLYMAEMNLQFAVTPVHDDGGSGSAHHAPTGSMPTVQFVETVQTFIRKCQSMNVTANEYFYMRMIALFRTGPGGRLEAGEAAERIHSEARQDLQEVVQHSHPDQNMRYITLLLTLHTLFSVNCSMLQALFCDPILNSSSSSSVGPGGAGGLEAFIRKRLEDRRASETSESMDSSQILEASAGTDRLYASASSLSSSSSSSSSLSVTPTETLVGLASGFTTMTTIGLASSLVAPTSSIGLTSGLLAPVTTGSWSMVGSS